MTVSIANLTSQWTNNSIAYTGMGLNVNSSGYATGSFIINYKFNGIVRYTLDPQGNVFVGGTHTVNSDARVNGSLVVANTITSNIITTTSLSATTLNVTTISANSISGNAANSLAIVINHIVYPNVGSFTYTPPANLISAMITVTGAGGGGGGADCLDTSAASAGAGGGAGGTAQKLYTLEQIGTSCSVVIGEGGNGGSGTNGTNGSNGADSTLTPNGTITDILTGKGGLGGTGGGVPSADSAFVAGGVGGSSSNGDINLTGQSGFYGLSIDTEDSASGGNGGASYYGGGGLGNTVPDGTDTSRAGGVGAAAGAGGGGAASVDTTTGSAGGKGANGMITIIEYKRQG